jgi:hypothetical protein
MSNYTGVFQKIMAGTAAFLIVVGYVTATAQMFAASAQIL